MPPSASPDSAGRLAQVPKRGLSWGGAVLSGRLSCGCGPSLSDRPSDFKGTHDLKIAVLCGDKTVGATESDSAWIKVSVRSTEAVTVDWPGISVAGRNARAVRRAAGRVTDLPEGGHQKIMTWWFVSAPVDGAGDATIGPVSVSYTGPKGGVRVESGVCNLKLK